MLIILGSGNRLKAPTLSSYPLGRHSMFFRQKVFLKQEFWKYTLKGVYFSINFEDEGLQLH